MLSMDIGKNTIGVEAKVAFLSRPAAYPDKPACVEVIETHMSYVFLTDRHAYKLKKPVRYAYLDFSTLALRRKDCAAELILNRRLAPDVYLGLVKLTGAPGGLALGGSGAPVDWLVKMRRLPRERMLDSMIRARTLTPADVEPAAALLARFYGRVARVPIAASAYVDRFAQEIDDNDRELCLFGMPGDLVARILAEQRRFLETERGQLERRAREGHILEGHGDLRPEHVHLGPPPSIIDCLEFSRALRILDPLDEIGFLAMECERLDAGFVGDIFLSAYLRATGDIAAPDLFRFYKAFRACLRARIALWHLLEPNPRDPEKWPRLALDYLRLAESCMKRIA